MENKDLPPVSPEAVQAQLARILRSRGFVRSERLARFLDFTVAQKLAGKPGSLKEYAIGVEVFGRKPDFDPQSDSIVRVQAVNLRARLVAYYEGEGARDPVWIEYTKGGYAPTFRPGPPGNAPVTPKAEPGTIAVLPFVNMSSDPENEYFSDGLTEELISVLSEQPGLRVVARTSVFQYKGKPTDVRQIGAELNVRMVLEGSVRKNGERLYITAQLVDAGNGYHSWSRRYRVDIKDLFAVQREIATAISGTLREHRPDLPKPPAENQEAYHAYLKGRFYLNRWTEQDFQKSIGFFEEALRHEPRMAAAYCGLADAYFVLACYGHLDPRKVMPKTRAAATQAMEIDESLAEAHVSLGAVLAVYDWEWKKSEREFQRAVQLDPSLATAHQWYGVLCLIPQGRLEEAERVIRYARDLDPLSPPINTSLGLVYFVQDRYDEALACFERAIEINPAFHLAHWWRGFIYLHRSMPLQAVASFRKAGVPIEAEPVKFAYREALLGKRGKAREALGRLTTLARDKYVSPVMLAAIHVVLGQVDEALACLERGLEEHDAWLAWLGFDRRFDALRAEPRFIALLDRIGVAGALLVRP